MPISVAELADSDLAVQYDISRAAWEADVPDIPFVSRQTFDTTMVWPNGKVSSH